MSSLSIADKQYVQNALRFAQGFSIETSKDLFVDLGVDIDSPQYAPTSQNDTRLWRFIELGDNEAVGSILIEIAGFIRNMELRGGFYRKDFSENVEKIGRKLIERKSQKSTLQSMPQATQATIDNNLISIVIRPEIYDHISGFLRDGHYFTAVEESYKIVRLKLEEITGSEKATEAFKPEHTIKLFGREPANQKEKDFFDGVKYLNMAIQFLRNEKAHVPAYQLDKNLAIHYLSLASLAYDLISRKEE